MRTRASRTMLAGLVASALAAIVMSPASWAQPGAQPGAQPRSRSATGAAPDKPADAIRLHVDPNVNVRPRSSKSDRLPTYGTADSMRSANPEGGGDTVLTGHAELRRRGLSMQANEIRYNEAKKTATAAGDVELVKGDLRMRGPELKLQTDTGRGFFERPHYQIGGRGRGRADRIELLGERRMRMHNATFTSCRVDHEDWRIEARTIDVDDNADTGSGRSARLRFKDATVLALPVFYFPLSDERKTGLLPPSFVTSSTLGFELQAPLYLNLAPNYDLTITARESSRRGLRLSNEGRYLFDSMRGTVFADIVPDDRVTHRSRHAYKAINQITDVHGWSGGWNINGVSDDDYFVDYASSVIDASQRSLPRDIYLTRPLGQWSFLTRVTSYQNILDARLAPPYERLPQFQLSTFRPDVHGFELGLLNDLTWFRQPLAGSAAGLRAVVRPSIAYPIRGASWYVTPKITGNLSTYQLEQNPAGATSLTRFIPTLSIDSGMVFERPTSWQGRALTQTLEPRLYYVYTPYHDQSQFPVFDTARMDFDFPQIFLENRFTGHDRIADSNLVTAALTSRFYDTETGAERLRLGIGQRFYFSPQRVTVPGMPANTDRKSDLLLGASVVLRQGLTINSGVQYSIQDSRVPRYSASIHYWPGNGRIFNLGVHYQAQVYAQYDASVQWPVSNHWSLLGKVNYSFLKDQATPGSTAVTNVKPGLVEGVAGFEYTEDCWAARFVVQRYVTTAAKYTNAMFFQVDLKGLGRAGPDPFSILVRTIQGYRVPTSNTAAPTPGYYGY